jgi:hypothetical protein
MFGYVDNRAQHRRAPIDILRRRYQESKLLDLLLGGLHESKIKVDATREGRVISSATKNM